MCLKGNTVGYDRKAVFEADRLLANLPVGYSDGYRRAFANRGEVLIRDKRVSVVGNISMNIKMVDVIDISGATFDGEVVLFGKQGNDEITNPEIEKVAGGY